MNMASAKKYAINAAFIVGVIVVINTIIKRNPFGVGQKVKDVVGGL